MSGPGTDENRESGPDPGPDERPGRVRPRPNIVLSASTSFRKRYEAVGYWTLMTVVLSLLVWFLVSSAVDRSEFRDAEATIIATLFVPETATAEAEAEAELQQAK